MPELPAFCDNCGLIFGSGLFFENSKNVQLLGCTSVCPRCNRDGKIPDGLYNFIENSIELITGPILSVERLKKINKLITELLNKKSSSKEVKDKIETDAPELKNISDVLPTNRNELYAFLALLISILTLIITQSEKGEEVHITTNNVTNHYNEWYSTQNQTNIINTNNGKEKIGRNEKCYCGSGLKYKKCHGIDK